MFVKLLQSSKTEYPKYVTLSGMLTLVKLLQPEKASEPILVTPFGMLIPVRLLFLLKTPPAINVIPAGTVILPDRFSSASTSIWLAIASPSFCSNCSASHGVPEKTLDSITATLSGMLTLARLLHPPKAHSPIHSTPSGMSILVRLLQF